MSSMLATTPSSSSALRPPASKLARPHLARVEAFGLSNTGRVRRFNEDSFLVASDVGLYAVADGMGGAAAGDVASRMAVATVRAVFEDPDLTWLPGLAPRPVEAGLPLLVSGVDHANARVYAAAKGDQAKTGMGTTFTGLLVLEDRFALAHVGDSRAYLLRDRRLEQLTFDHTLVNEFVQSGTMTREQAEVSNLRHILSRAVGTDASVTVDRRLIAAEPGDTVLLASDGLHGVISDEQIAAILLGERELTRVATQLIECTNDAGGPDNITVVLARLR